MPEAIEVIPSKPDEMTTPEPGLRRQVMSYSPSMMLVRHTMTKGWVGTRHSHPHEQMVYIVSGGIRASCIPAGTSRRSTLATVSSSPAASSTRPPPSKTPKSSTSSRPIAKTTPASNSASRLSDQRPPRMPPTAKARRPLPHLRACPDERLFIPSSIETHPRHPISFCRH